MTGKSQTIREKTKDCRLFQNAVAKRKSLSEESTNRHDSIGLRQYKRQSIPMRCDILLFIAREKFLPVQKIDDSRTTADKKEDFIMKNRTDLVRVGWKEQLWQAVCNQMEAAKAVLWVLFGFVVGLGNMMMEISPFGAAL